MGARKRVLYISYDDITEPLSESQVLPYLNRLAEKYDVFLLTFNKKKIIRDAMRFIAEKNSLKGLYCLQYHKRPSLPATLWDIACGTIKSLDILKKERISFIHARSYVACSIALWLKKITGTPYIFDIRGLLADERADSGDWDKGSIAYKAVKAHEKTLFREACRVVVLSSRGADITEKDFSVPKDRIYVIPTCVDTNLFRPENDPHTEAGCLKFIYVGSLGTWYMLSEMLDFIKTAWALKGKVKFLILTRSDTLYAKALLKEKGLNDGLVEIKKALHEEVPRYLRENDASIFFIRPTFSKKFSCPTKFAESLSAGIPVITNSGIGDLDGFIKKYSVGATVDNFSASDYERAVNNIFVMLEERKALSERCRNLSLKEFSLESGVDKYVEVYEAMK